MTGSEQLDTRPLYLQVQELLTRRISSGSLGQGAALPSEFQIADELGVSQGTVRKALDALAAARLVVRVQGKGTFVVEQTPEDVHFRFFNIFNDNDHRVLPDSRGTKVTSGQASALERRKLGLDAKARVCRIRRLRTVDDEPFIVERIVVPEAVFPGLSSRTRIPNTLYDLFQSDFGILVIRAHDRVFAEACDVAMADVLGIPTGAPLTVIDRVAHDIHDMPVEWRVSHCHMAGRTYVAAVD
ncbi:MAG: GntR family transcriptional regulator [Hyphomicrobiaceae bacterium]